MQNLNAEPTVVLIIEGGQIARIVGSQNLRVIVLDGDTAGAGEEDAARLLNVGSNQFYVTDVRVEGQVERTPAGVQGVDAKYCADVAKMVEAMPKHHLTATNVPGAHLSGFPMIKSVKVKHWGCYDLNGTRLTHQIDVDDQRLDNGQVYLTIGSLEGNVDELMSVTAEVNTNPLTGLDHVPCLHVHFDSDALAFTIYKLNDKILLRPETDVTLKPFVNSQGGSNESLFMIE
jgi:hypothetical protein